MSKLNEMKQRLRISGGNADGRNVKQKLSSMYSALWNSYQAEWITLDKEIDIPDRNIRYRKMHYKNKWRCLIGPEKLTTDYDQKIISIDFDAHLHPGDTFLWDRTGKHWLIYTVFTEEEAYLRARIRQCDYQIECNEKKYWIWMRGPVETSLVWRQKHQIEFNDLNYSLLFYITADENTKEFFSRHQIVKFDGHNWRVAATDKYSQDGIIEVYLEEYFDNSMEDDMVAIEVEKPDTTKAYISGSQEVHPYDTDLLYSIVSATGGTFTVDSQKVKITELSSSSCTLEILTGRSGSFNLIYSRDGEDDIILPIIISSL